jgi:hypothetical protein
MSDLTVNGHAVLRGMIVLPRLGLWWARLVVDTDVRIRNPIVIESAAGFRRVGWARENNISEGRAELSVVPPRGILNELGPVAYRPVGGVRVRTILEDWARETGIELSPTIKPELLEQILPAWVRDRGAARMALSTFPS